MHFNWGGCCSCSPVTFTVTDIDGTDIGVLFAIQGTLAVTSLSSVLCMHLAWLRVSLIVHVIASRFDGLTN